MVYFGANLPGQFNLYNTKRTIFITRKSGCTNKHFMHEKKKDYVNPLHQDWTYNPPVGFKRTNMRI